MEPNRGSTKSELLQQDDATEAKDAQLALEDFNAYEAGLAEMRERNETYDPYWERVFRLYATTKGFWRILKQRAEHALVWMEDDVPLEVQEKAIDFQNAISYDFEYKLLNSDIWEKNGTLAGVKEIQKWMDGVVKEATQFLPASIKAVKELEAARKMIGLVAKRTQEAVEGGSDKLDVDTVVEHAIFGHTFPFVREELDESRHH